MSKNKKFVNELRPEFLGIHSLNSFSPYNSSSRSTMFANHFSQRLVTIQSDEKLVQSGTEQEFGKFTFKTKMPESGKIIAVIDRYPVGVSQNSIGFNPETIVIYENSETKQIDCFSIPYFKSYHQYFGFQNKIIEENYNQIKPGAYIPKDVIFADSPSIGENGSFNYGINANVAFMSMPDVAEDGVKVSEDFVKRMAFKLYETRVVEFGSKHIPLNLYGDINNYIPFPEIGTKLRDDGILMMTREIDPVISPVMMSKYDLMEPDFIFDKATYARGGDGIVVDIKVISNNNLNKKMPPAMCGYIDKYKNALLKFHRELLAVERRLREDNKRKFGHSTINISPRFHRLLVESLAVINHNAGREKQQVQLLYRKAPIDEYRIEFVIEYTITPGIGFKLTDVHGINQ